MVPKKLKKLVVVDAIKAVFIYIFTAIIILSSKIKITSKEYKTAELPSINGNFYKKCYIYIINYIKIFIRYY